MTAETATGATLRRAALAAASRFRPSSPSSMCSHIIGAVYSANLCAFLTDIRVHHHLAAAPPAWQ
ncbi:hypothetical protein CCM_07205 [Cordyceps militaris CM01]|uniref:Uncharacterized protein n=1 Tax=Cordyceps militaris (strain CM01) TaxID=983644 RepID=G3JM61_CORMM|nr:uncharacterized protein CCM_07205 [Cordyceps militaris CM01]EGX90785.1 hypothetical protein CCM_07205 [Cordyceps militaris CM01]